MIACLLYYTWEKRFLATEDCYSGGTPTASNVIDKDREISAEMVGGFWHAS